MLGAATLHTQLLCVATFFRSSFGVQRAQRRPYRWASSERHPGGRRMSTKRQHAHASCKRFGLPSPTAAAGRLHTVVAALLFLLQGPPVAAAAAPPDKVFTARHPLPPSLSRTTLAVSAVDGESGSGDDRQQAGRSHSSEREGTAPGRSTLHAEDSRPRRRGLASASSGSSSSPGSAGVDCSDELLACTRDRTCLSCVDAETVNVAECLEEYHLSDSDLGEEVSFCQGLGGSYCCAAYEMFFSDSAVNCVDVDNAVEYWTCSLESNGCSLDDLPCYGVNMTAILEAGREATTTSEEETYLTSSGDVDPDQNGSRRASPAFFSPNGGVGDGVVGGFLLCAIVVRVVTVASWN
eukprot:g10141.t1